MARLTEYNYELCIKICEEVAEGKNIMRILEHNNEYPSWSTFRRWKRDNEELRTLYINAQQDKAEQGCNGKEVPVAHMIKPCDALKRRFC